MSLFNKFKIGLGKSSSGLTDGFKNIFSKKNIDDEVLTKFEELIISSDAGVEVAKELRKDFENLKIDKKIDDHKEILKLIAEKMAIDLLKYEKDLSLMGNAKSSVIVVSGVNGAGKTTSIGKLGKYFKDNNRSVVFGAADTFRAAAIDQLQVWAAKVKVDIIKSEINSDPASVAFTAIERAMKEQVDVLFIDTAGRLHNNTNLMQELAKIERVVKKIIPEAPHETMLVLDGGTGQNAFMQAKLFAEATAISGLILTKLDGTAKGGVVIGISDELEVPIRYIGVGEGTDDLIPFETKAFLDSLFQKTSP